MPLALPNAPQSLAALQAMRGIIIAECLVGGASPFAALPAVDAVRYGVGVAVFVGKPKDFKDAYLPQCTLWLPPGDANNQVVDYLSYNGRMEQELDAVVTLSVDLRTDWYAGEQQILALRDALWPALLHHEQLGGTVAGVIEAEAYEGAGLGYETVAGVDYRTYEARWWVRLQWQVAGGRSV